ncbi:hypothetical protein [Ureaplasma ceti]|uniref:Uncharacterized protein n=1 Tax=Ureaplasma ceti TaxID=3119530 RepID=A0ABP9U5C0_9BACT
MDNKLVNGLKIRMMFPFYIDNIHKSFFDNEVGAREGINAPLLLEKINKVLDNIHYLKDLLVKKTSPNNLVPHYAVIKDEGSDFVVAGDKLANKKVIFALEVNPNHDAFKIVEQIQFNLYLDEQNKLLSAGFSFNWGNANAQRTFESLIKKVYEVNLLSFFISKEFRGLPVSEWDAQWLSEFNNLWEKWLTDKASKDLEMNLNFQGLIKLFMIANVVHYEIKNYFQKPNVKKEKNKVNKSTSQLIRVRHLLHLNTSLKSDFCLEKPFLSYEIIRDSQQPFLDEDDNIFLSNNNFKLLYLIMINPEVFGITNRYSRLVQFSDLLTNISAYNTTKNVDGVIDDLVEETICEWNYDYVTFVNSELTSLIVKNNNPIDISDVEKPSIKYELDANRKVFNLYFWSVIFIHTKMQKMINIDDVVSNAETKMKTVEIFESKERLNNLRFSFHGNYFGNPALKKIVKKMMASVQINNFLEKIDTKVSNGIIKIHLDKRVKNTVYAFVIALIFGLFDFLNTVFTILAESKANEEFLGTSQIVVIVISSLFAVVLVAVLGYAAYSSGGLEMIKRKIKEWRKEIKNG